MQKNSHLHLLKVFNKAFNTSEFNTLFSNGYEVTNARLRIDKRSVTKWPTLGGYEMVRLLNDQIPQYLPKTVLYFFKKLIWSVVKSTVLSKHLNK